ncbi:hypothetical protein D3C73_783820 [compost metagenome]
MAPCAALTPNVPPRLFCAARLICAPVACTTLPLSLSMRTSPPQLYLAVSKKSMRRPARSSCAPSARRTSPCADRLSLPLGSSTAVSSSRLPPRLSSAISAPSAAASVALSGVAAAPLPVTCRLPPALIVLTEPAAPVSSGVLMNRSPPVRAYALSATFQAPCVSNTARLPFWLALTCLLALRCTLAKPSARRSCARTVSGWVRGP